MTAMTEQIGKPGLVSEINCSSCDAVLPLTGLEPLTLCLCDNCDTPFHVPLQIGQYLLKEKLSDNGVVAEFYTFDVLLNRYVILKKLSKVFYSKTTPDFPFIEGAGAVNVYSSTVHEGELYLVLEHIKGTNMDEYLEGGAVAKEQVINIALKTAEVLKEAAAEGVHHGNLNPANIWVDEKGNIKLTDFMLCQNILLSQPNCTPQRVSKVLDIRYNSFNRLNNLVVDEKSDVYSFAVCLYKMLTGTLPYRSTDLESLTAEISLNEIDIDPLIDSGTKPWLIKMIMSILAGSSSFENFSTVIECFEHNLSGQAKTSSRKKSSSSSSKSKTSSKSKKRKAQVKLPSRGKSKHLKSKRNLKKLFK